VPRIIRTFCRILSLPVAIATLPVAGSIENGKAKPATSSIIWPLAFSLKFPGAGLCAGTYRLIGLIHYRDAYSDDLGAQHESVESIGEVLTKLSQNLLLHLIALGWIRRRRSIFRLLECCNDSGLQRTDIQRHLLRSPLVDRALR